MDKAYFKEYYHQERNHWWFRARQEILDAIVARHAPAGEQERKIRILNAGIATGATSIMLEKHGEVTSLEYDADCCAFVEEQLGIEVVNASLTELPFEDGEFDVICAFDVVEHIEDDQLAIAEIHRCLRPGGRAFLTVPAFEELWSEHDVINHHFRRYRRPDFVRLQENAGLSVRYDTYFNTFLFPPIASVRGLNRLINGRAAADEDSIAKAKSDFERFNTKGITNRILYQVFLAEKTWLAKGNTFPAGISVLTVAEKMATTEN